MKIYTFAPATRGQSLPGGEGKRVGNSRVALVGIVFNQDQAAAGP
jgi:hypothetical protein